MSKIQNIIRKSVYITLGNIDQKLGRKNPITIFAYHGISNDGWRFNIAQSSIEKHILFLKKEYELVTLNDIQKFLEGKIKFTKPVASITFDDGYKNIYSLKNFAKQNSIKPTVFVLSDTKQANRIEMGNEQQFLSETEIINLKKDGWEIGCHSATHPDFYSINASEMIKETLKAKKDIENRTNALINFFAFPRGRYTKNAIDMVKKSKFKLAVSMDDAKITKSTNKYVLPRVGVDATHTFSEFKYLNSPLVILFRKCIKQSFLNQYISI